MEAARWQEQAKHFCPVRDNLFTFVRNRWEKENGQTRPARSAHAGIAPQSTDFSGLGEALRLDHCPGSSRTSGRWPLNLLDAFSKHGSTAAFSTHGTHDNRH